MTANCEPRAPLQVLSCFLDGNGICTGLTLDLPVRNVQTATEANLIRLLTVLLILLTLPLTGQAAASKRIALVIGNADYVHAPKLANPRNDAVDMAIKLEQMGFEVVRGADLTMGQTRAAVRNFILKLNDADMALFYYAGHGVQVNGENYMAPVDAKLTSYDFLEFETLPVETVIRAMERNVKTNLVVLDACRDNPLAQNLARSMGTRSGDVGRGLAKVGSGIGTLVAFSTQPGNVALDGDGRNSPYTAALLKHLGTPGADITRDLVKVRNEVLATTNGKQVPWENSSLTGEVILVPKLEPPKLSAKTKPQPAGNANRTAELAYWDSIKSAGSAAYYQAYLDQWPGGIFASIARIRIEDLKRKAERAVMTKVPKTSGDETKIAILEPAKSVEQLQPGSDPVMNEELVRSIQRQLNRLGCSVGGADGKWGNGSRAGLRNYAKHNKSRLASLDPSPDLLNTLKKQQGRICPLTCRSGYRNTNGKCIKVVTKSKVRSRARAKSSGSSAAIGGANSTGGKSQWEQEWGGCSGSRLSGNC